jgi:GABA(A) receptor-associated protein
MALSYKRQHTLQERRAESDRITAKYPERIPIICERYKRADVPELDKTKFLTPCDLTAGQFLFVIRRRLSLKPDKALFLTVRDTMVPSSQRLKDVYAKHKDIDGFLYVVYATESTFGDAVTDAA